ncbi:MAG: hypothetical protein JXA73_08945 [Acidobacteria bacterium]|nr:hypothetical protein [Acidobacteriota bacterium]
MRLVIPDIPRSPNGTNGLLRMGQRARTKYNQYWRELVRSQIDNSHKPRHRRCAVFISQMRRKSLDRDNLYSSCKPILDALVHWKLIRDDSEKWIDFQPVQVIGKERITIIQIVEI